LAIDVIVNDTSCLIDLRKGGILTTALLLPFRFVVALPLVAAELNDFDETDWEDLCGRGLEIVDLDGAQVQCAMRLKSQFPGLSVYGCFSLAIVQTTPNSMLLTGDRLHRTSAVEVGVKVHGVLWVSDQIEQARLISFADLADALERLDADPLVFLPDDEITKRIARLRKKSKGR
jgi:predicted nucleic acid-binding protein